MFFARYFRNRDPWWFKMHRALQVMEWPLFLNARILHNFTLKRINPHQGYSDFPGIPFFTHPQTNVPSFVNIFGNIFFCYNYYFLIRATQIFLGHSI
jgi:hypothetical protein